MRAAAGLLWASLLAPVAALTAEDSPARLFLESSPLELELHADFRALGRDRDEATAPWRDAVLHFSVDGEPRALPIGIHARGNFRMDRGNCRFPQLYLRFAGADVAGTPFDGQRETPLATHCRETSRYEQYLVLEYLAYEIYSLLSGHSLSVRPARVTYSDSGSRRQPVTRFAFFIEHFTEFAERHESTIVEIRPFDPAAGEPQATVLFDLFQYMIGNTDWSQVYGHNVLLLRAADGAIRPVGYDFDFSGLVSASYAAPDDSLPIRSVRQRLYRGVCRPAAQFEQAFDSIAARRSDVLALIDAQPGLDERTRRQAREYLSDFYAEIASPHERERRIVGNCRSMEF